MNAVSPVVTCDDSLRVGQDRGTACQFGHPSGWVGAVVGHLMAVKNLPMNRLVVELLDVKPEDAVLEIGFGPGQAIKLFASQTADISDVPFSLSLARPLLEVETEIVAIDDVPILDRLPPILIAGDEAGRSPEHALPQLFLVEVEGQ